MALVCLSALSIGCTHVCGYSPITTSPGPFPLYDCEQTKPTMSKELPASALLEQKLQYKARMKKRAALIATQEGFDAANQYMRQEASLQASRMRHERLGRAVTALEAIERIIRQGQSERYEDGPGSDGEDTHLMAAIIPSGAAIIRTLGDLVSLVGAPVAAVGNSARRAFSGEALTDQQQLQSKAAYQNVERIKHGLKAQSFLTDWSRDSRDFKRDGIKL